jgi:hypothetical protein
MFPHVRRRRGAKLCFCPLPHTLFWGKQFVTVELWAWKQNMCSTTCDLRLQMYAFRFFFLLVSFRSLPPPTFMSTSKACPLSNFRSTPTTLFQFQLLIYSVAWHKILFYYIYRVTTLVWTSSSVLAIYSY